MNAKRIRPGSAPSDNRFCRRIRSSEEDASAGQARSCSAAAGGGASGSPLCRRSGAAGGVSGCGRTLGRMLFCILLLGVVLPLGSCRRMAEKAQRNIRLEAVEKARRQGLSGAEIVLRIKNGTGHKLKLEKASLTVYYAGGVVTKVALREPAEAPRRATASRHDAVADPDFRPDGAPCDDQEDPGGRYFEDRRLVRRRGAPAVPRA